MRLGGPVFKQPESPDEWVAAHRELGYRAAYCPVGPEADDDTVRAYAEAAEAADLLIAEVGAWGNNPLHEDHEVRRQAVANSCRCLDLADRIGARCCVNVAGSRGERWAGPHPEDLSEDTFAMIVDTVREIVDTVRPRRTCWALEPMPWIWPDSPAAYARLLQAVNRRSFGVHLDPVNMINCPRRLFDSSGFLRECFNTLGPCIRSIHAKDSVMQPGLTTHLDEVRPGLGRVDYQTFLRLADTLGPDTPFMLEHLDSAEEYALAAQYVREQAAAAGVDL